MYSEFVQSYWYGITAGGPESKLLGRSNCSPETIKFSITEYCGGSGKKPNLI